MPLALTVLAEASATIHYKLARLQTLVESGWWHWLALLAAVTAVAAYVIWMYRNDSGELPRGLAVTLCLLRLVAFGGVLFFFFGLEKRAERQLVKNSRAILLIDTSQSMGLRDSDNGTPAAMNRIEQVAAELAGGTLIGKLREKHDVIAYRFDQADAPVEIASFPRTPTAEETADAQLSEADRLRQIVAESRWLVYIAAGVLAVSVLAGLVYLVGGASGAAALPRRSGPQAGEPTSWALLLSMTTLIAAVVIMAVATLRGSEAGPLAIFGLREVEVANDEASPANEKEEQQIPQVDWATQLSPRGVETRIGDNLKQIIEKERGGPIAAVVLFTDGGGNAGTEPKLAAAAAADALVPIFPVGLGSDKRPANLRVVDLEAPERVYPGDKFTLTGYVQAQNYNRGNVTVELLAAAADGSNETKVDELALDIGKSGQVAPVKFELTPEEQGLRQFKLRVRTFEGEADRRDNEKTAKVEIIDRRTRVLLMAGGPMRDFIFLRNQLFRDQEVISDVWLQSGKPGISQEANDVLQEFPKDEDALFEYDCIVAFDPDWEQLDEADVKRLEKWVAEKAGGLVIVTGPVFTPQWSSRLRGDERIDKIKALYPVVFYQQGSATLSLGRFGSDKAWPLEFTRDGKEAEFLWLDDSADTSQATWQKFDGVSGYYAVKDFKSGARVYARFGDPETAIDNVQPIYMAGQFYGSGRVFFLASGEMWRVRAIDDTYFEQFYTKLIRWAAEGRLLRDSSRGVLLVDKDRTTLGDQVAVRAILQDAQHEPLALPQVQATIVQPDNTRLPLRLMPVKDEGRAGIYVEQFTVTQEGDYRIEVQHPAAADQFLTREVRVKIPDRESEFPERNDALLREIADATGGDYFVGVEAAVGKGPSGRASLFNLIKPQDQTTVLPGTPDRAFERQLMGWLLGLICGALCLEWLLRRLSRLA